MVSVAQAQADASVRAIEALNIPLLEWSFSPGDLTVSAGSTVTWSTVGIQEHTATADNGAFNGTFARSRPFVATFTASGTYTYLCTPHPWMRGTITVLAASAAPDPLPEDEEAPS